MSTQRDRTHVSADRMQALLDGGLGQTEVRAVREHVSTCARCRSELDAWSTLYGALDGLDELTPSPDFSARVMAGLPRPEPERLPLVARVRSWLGLGRRTRPATAEAHPEPATLQELLDGALAARRARTVEAHLGGCRLCRDEVEGWRRVMVHLDRLPVLEPSAAFAERVMAHVRVQSAVAAARPSLRERVTNWLALNPRTRKRLAALAGAGVTPAVTVALVAWTVFSHPLVTPGNLASFLWLKLQSLAGGLTGAAAGHLAENGAVVRIWQAVEPLTRSAEVTAAAATLLGGLTVAAVWILYRNLFTASPAEHGYARLPF